METRIYEQSISINTDHVKEFYDNRAKNVAEKGMSAVLLQDRDQQAVAVEDAAEKEVILSKLDIGPDKRVLELGCGIGRLAEVVIPRCGFYCGIDFSEEMIRAARAACGGLGGRARFHTMSCLEAAEKDADFFGGRFDCLIASGIMTYVNDQDMMQTIQNLPHLLNDSCRLYFQDPVGIGKRLTLREFYSDALQSSYSAIYRTPEEYNQAYEPLLKAGFSITEQGPVPWVKQQYADSGRWYTFLGRQG